MQAFAAALFRDAPGPFVDADAAYVCAFSLMMLNTDLHNPAVCAKMIMAILAVALLTMAILTRCGPR